MRFEQGFDPEWHEILREPVTQAESKQLLERLASPVDFEGGADISAICEVTGSSPELVGRILADIRGTTWENLFGQKLSVLKQKLQSHDERLASQAEQISMIGDHLGVKVKSKRELEIEREIRSMAEASIADRRNGYWGLLVALVVLFFLFVIVPAQRAKRIPDGMPPISRNIDGNGSTAPGR